MNKLSSLFFLFFVTIQAYNIQRQFVANSTQNFTSQPHVLEQTHNNGNQSSTPVSQGHHNASGKGFVLNHHLDSISVEKEKAVEHIQYYETPDAKASSKNRIVHPQANNINHPKVYGQKYQQKAAVKPKMRHHKAAKHHLQTIDNNVASSPRDQTLQNSLSQFFPSDSSMSQAVASEPQDQAADVPQENSSDSGAITTPVSQQTQEPIDSGDEGLLPDDLSDQEPSASDFDNYPEIQTEPASENEDQESDNGVAATQQWPPTDQNEPTDTEDQGQPTVPPQIQAPVTNVSQTPPAYQPPQAPPPPVYPTQTTIPPTTTTQPPYYPSPPQNQFTSNAYPPSYQAPAGYPPYASTTLPAPQPQQVPSFQQPSSPIQVCPSQIENVGCYNVAGTITQLLPTLVSTKQPGKTLEELLCACAYIAQNQGWNLLAISEDSCYSGQNAAPFENGGLANSCINDSGATCGPSDEYCQGVTGSASIYKVIPEVHRSKVSKKLPKKH